MESMVGRRLDGVASLPARALGLFIDGLITAPIMLAALHWIHPLWLASVIAIGADGGYHIPQIAIWGMTPGARAAGVRVTRADGKAPGWARALVRWVTPGVLSNGFRLVGSRRVGPFVSLVVLVVVYGPALLDERRRALSDRVAGTVVLDRAQREMPSLHESGDQRWAPASEGHRSMIQPVRGLAVAIAGLLLVASLQAWWTWAGSRADRGARQQAAALESSLKGLKPFQLLIGNPGLLGPNVNLVSMEGDANGVVIKAEPRSLPHIRCVLATLDAEGHYSVVIRHSSCHSQ